MKHHFFLLSSLVMVGVIAVPTVAFGQNVNVGLEVPFGDNNVALGLADYIARLYTFIISTIGIIAAVMIMFHGFQWAAAAGNSDIIGKAKDGILHAIIGVVLAFSSYIILYVINPELVVSTNPVIPEPIVVHHDDSPLCAPGDSDCNTGIQYLTRPISGEKIPVIKCDPTPGTFVTINVFGMTTKIHKDVAASLQAVDAEWRAAGGQTFQPITPELNARPANPTELEGYNCRNVIDRNGVDTGRPSNHSWGLAIDINAKTNPYGSTRSTFDPRFVQMMADHGWAQGMKFKDPQHFSKLENEGGDGLADFEPVP